MGRILIQQMIIFLKIAIDYAPYHPFVSLDTFTDGQRLEQQKNSLSSIFVAVRLTPDLMNNVVAKCHVSEDSSLPVRRESVLMLLKHFANFLSNRQVVGIRLTVNEIRPV